MNTTQKHEFALFVAGLSKQREHDIVTLTDAALVVRINSVLRLQPHETCILFDTSIHARCALISVTKKLVTLRVLAQQDNQQVRPDILCLLPLLKREDLETALYAAVELGANKVQLVLTEKVQRPWSGAKEYERLQRIMIAAAEQSKNFALPELCAPQAFAQALATIPAKASKLFFDTDGQPALTVMQQLAQQKPAVIALLVGPEGDLTTQEKELLTQQHFVVCALTPTVMRAVSAASLGLGILRSCLK